jgi:uncharacterized protein
MICPVCHKDALIVEYNNVELDYCPNCNGVWFDSGELELLLEAAGLGTRESFLAGMKNSQEADIPEKKRRCPICLRKMRKVYIDEQKKIVTDVCKGGHGIWFDGGEVTGLIESLANKESQETESKRVLSFVRDMFKYQK